MKRSALYTTLAALSVIVFAAVEIPERQDLNRRIARYQNEKTTVERLEQDYLRPVLDQPVEQNAATWYERALPNLTRTPLNTLQPALQAGAAGYDLATESLLSGPCAEIEGDRIQTALRCTHCDWHLGFDAASLNRFVHAREALTLAGCFTIAGHRSAHRVELQDAGRRYLQGLAVACDLGNGNSTMLLVALRAAADNLLALGKLVATANDDALLRYVARNLALFEHTLPDGRVPLWRERLWTENQVALNELEGAGRERPGFGFIGVKQVMGTRALAREDGVFKDAEPLTHLSTRSEGIQLAERLKADAAGSQNEIVRSMPLPQDAILAVSTIELAGIYHAVEAAIELQRWKLEHGTYPTSAGQTGIDLQPYELRYERSIDGQGYKLIGPRSTLIER